MFREIQHEVTKTSEESAAARGEPLKIGGKALLLKVAGEFRIFVLPANLKLDSSTIKEKFETKRTRFASREELTEMTGLVSGAVPPFGRPILPFELYVDRRLTHNDRIAFNAGSLTISFIVGMEDFLRVAKACEVFEFSKE